MNERNTQPVIEHEVRRFAQPELYRIRDAAVLLAVSPRMIYSLIESGVLKAVRLPGVGTKRRPVRIARADLLALIERQRNESNT